MPIDPKELTKVPKTAAFSRIRYVSLLEEGEIVQFFRGLLAVGVEARDDGDWERVSRYIADWEDRIDDTTLLLGRQAYETGPWTPLAKPITECKLAIVTTGGVYLDGDKPFDTTGDWSFRALPKDMSHDKFRIAHEKYDLSGVLEDINTVFPVDTLKELESERVIGALAETNYGFMGFIPKPEGLIFETAPEVAKRLKADGVDAVLIPTT